MNINVKDDTLVSLCSYAASITDNYWFKPKHSKLTYKDIAFNFDDLVLEPCCGAYNSSWCKDDMVARKVPCIIAVPKEVYKDSWDDSFDIWIGADGIKKYYFGDEMEID